MKFFLVAFAALLTVNVYATIRTVSNNPSTIAQFNTIQAAIDAAVSGDTILVHGSPNDYAGFGITNKKLAIIGPGWKPDKNLPHTANIVGAVGLSGVGASGSELHGLTMFASVSISTGGVFNIRFIRNRIYRNLIYMAPSGGGLLSGYMFEGNWFDDGGVISHNFTTIENVIFQNNLFYNSGNQTAVLMGFTNSTNVQFDHNLFYGPASGTRDVFAINCRFITLSNNVFVRNNPANNLTSALFYNNITFNSGNDVPWTVNGNVDGGGNLAGEDPQMNAQASVNAGVNNPLLDFSIAGGPANNSGTDGKDRGLLYELVGSLNWMNCRTSRLPYIFGLQTNTPTVAPGGSITISVEARTSN